MNRWIKNKRCLPPLAMLCALLWALAYPFIKLGYRELGIAADDLGSKILFAGIRFLLAGCLVLFLSGVTKRKKIRIRKNAWGWLLLFALVNTSLHYLFAYVGLGFTPSARGTILDSMGSFFLILLSCSFFADDQMSGTKAVGCVLGFAGIVILNIQPGQSLFAEISFRGDGMILLNALCGAFGGVLSRIVSRKMDMTVATGISMGLGGALLCVTGLCIGTAKPWQWSLAGGGILLVLTLISAISFSIYNTLLAYHPISTVAIYNAFIPVFGVCFSSLLLREAFYWKYLLACLFVAAGIFAVNHKKEKQGENS